MSTTINYSLDQNVREILSRKTKFSSLMRLDPPEVEGKVSTTSLKLTEMKNENVVKAKGGGGFEETLVVPTSSSIAFRTETIFIHDSLTYNIEINEDSIRRGYVEDVVQRFLIFSNTSVNSVGTNFDPDLEEREGVETVKKKSEFRISHPDYFSDNKKSYEIFSALPNVEVPKKADGKNTSLHLENKQKLYTDPSN
jgi:hypothetical protein